MRKYIRDTANHYLDDDHDRLEYDLLNELHPYFSNDDECIEFIRRALNVNSKDSRRTR